MPLNHADDIIIVNLKKIVKLSRRNNGQHLYYADRGID